MAAAFRVKRLKEEARLPKRQNPGDAGLDLFATEDATVYSGYAYLAETGISIQLPVGYAGLITPRSGLALKNGITVLNSPGLIDSGYRGEIGVILYNANPNRDFIINKGDRIAQLVIISTPVFIPVEMENLDETERGSGGFGSTN